jgi:hypothetical protein
VPILRIRYDGGPWDATIGNQLVEPPPLRVHQLRIHTSDPPVGYYEIVPKRLLPSTGADYRATWVPADET